MKFERVTTKTEQDLFMQLFNRKSFRLESRNGTILRIESDDPDIKTEALRLGLIEI